MIFESINYYFLLQDFFFSMAVGFVVAVANQAVSVFIYKGRAALFVKDIFVCTLFAAALFSYVVSFANYPVVRFYHIIAAFAGFLSFNIRFSAVFQKIFEKIFKFFYRKILCFISKIKSIICVLDREKCSKRKKASDLEKDADLKNGEVLVYNL